MKYISQIYNLIKSNFKKKVTVHVLGDSHAQVFEYMFKNKDLYPFNNMAMDFCIVQGATNMGLANPHSKTQAMPIFKKHLSNVRKGDFILFILGEVDCGFVIWYRSQKMNIDVKEQFLLSLKNYKELILYASEIVGKKIIICDTPLPTITDGNGVGIGDVANKRLEVTATQRERTDITFKYNRALEEICLDNNFYLLGYQKDILDLQTKLISSKFLNENPKDHHLSNIALANILYPKLKKILNCN